MYRFDLSKYPDKLNNVNWDELLLNYCLGVFYDEESNYIIIFNKNLIILEIILVTIDPTQSLILNFLNMATTISISLPKDHLKSYFILIQFEIT